VTLLKSAGVMQHLRQCVQALALNGRPPTTRSPGWWGRIKIGVEAQSGDDADVGSDRAEEVNGGKCRVADDDDAPGRQPAMDL
jgi:hypothetical protein